MGMVGDHKESGITGRIRVLHVDDEPDFAETTAAVLEHGHERIEVTTETSASDGLDHLTDEVVDCVVSDYDMPDVDGLEFLESVREEHPNLPFILFTGEGSEQLASEARSAGVTDYLHKEGGTEQYERLATRIGNVVTRHRGQ